MQQHFYAFRNTLAATLVLILVSTTAILRGQTLYVGPDNGDWLTAANWNAGLPSATNAPTVSGGKIVCINGSLTIDYAVQNFGTIINKGTTTITTGSILSGGALENQGTLTVSSGGSVTSSGGMLNSGTVNNGGNFNSNSAWTNTVTGSLTNTATFMQLAPITNNGTVANNGGLFTCPQAFTNNKTVTNASGATFKVDFGGSFSNNIGSTLSNAGAFQNLATFTNNTTVTNTGTFTNNGVHTCNGVFNNESGGRLESTAVVNVSGRINNKTGATVVSGFRFNVLANGYVSSFGQFTNNDMIDVKALGTFCTETGSILTGNFGSSIVNAGYFKISLNSTVTTNGSISNSKKFDNYGTYDAMGGGQITNTDSICNFSLIKNVNIITNSGVWKNNGITENNSGGIWTNTGKIENAKGATISNNFEVLNKPTGTIVNNGTFNNNIRLFNEGTITNNAYFVTAGDLFNKVGGTLINTEVLVVREGSIVNEGTLTNQKTLINDGCSVITNKSSISNTGRFENSGIVFQRGTITGNAILALSGHIQTGTGSAAPSICRTALTSGVDGIGEAKVYGQNPVKEGIGLDACAGFQYFVDNTTRMVYTCPQIGQTINAPFKLLTRTGDSLTCTIPITIFDNVSPVVDNCPKDATIFTLNNTAPYSWATITATDNCGDTPSVSTTNASGSLFNIGTTQVTISVKDSRLNTTDCTFKVNVVKVFSSAVCPATDAAAPTFTGCPTNQTLASTGGNVAAVWNAPSVSDNCYPIVMQQNFNSGTTFAPGVTTVTYTAKDPSGNVGTCSFTITVTAPADVCVTDNIKPVINGCPPNFFGTLNTAINGAVGYWRTPSAFDNCGGIATFTANAVSGSIFPAGVTPITYTATDVKGNTSTCTFNVYVEATNPCAGDVTAPTLTCPANVSVNATGNTAVATWTAPTATDACAPVQINSTHQSGANFQVGTTTVTYLASDKVGNQSKCSFNVVVNNPCANDTLAPVITNCPANQTINSTNGTNAVATWTAPSVSDNCTMAGLTSNFPSGSTFGVGTTNVVYTATDAKGNAATCTFSITVNTAPVATCAGNVVLNPSFETNFTDWFTTDVTTVSITNDAKTGAKAAQICGDNKPILSKLTSLLGGTYTATVQAKTTGAPTTAFVGIEFYDAAGVVIPAARITRPVTTTAYGAITFTFTKPTTASNFAFIANKTGAAGCLVIDDVCVTNPCTNDVTPPTFTGCPANITVNGTGTATTGIATWTAPVASDNCSTPAVVSNFTSGQSFPLGATTVTYTATDSKGLTGTCSFTVTYVNPCANDVTPPSFGTTCPTNKTATSTNGLCVAVNFTAPTATDNCGTPSVSGTHAADFCFPIGTTNVTYTASDAKNNKATCTFTVTVTGSTDCIAAQATGGVLREYWDSNTGWTSPVVLPTTAPTSTNIMTNFQGPQNIADNYSTRVRGYIRPTVSGNYTFIVTGDDYTDLYLSTSTNPTNKTRIASILGWTGNAELYKYPSQKSATIALVAGQNYYVELAHMEGGGGDNFAVYWSTDATTYTIIPGTNLVPYAGNCPISTCATDVTPPVITCPANQTVNQNATCSTATWSPATATDNCGTPSVIQIGGTSSGGCFSLGTSTVTYRATDSKGFQAVCSFYITVVDPCVVLNNSAVTEYNINNSSWLQGSSVTVNAGDNLSISANPNGLVSYTWTGPNGFSKVGNAGGDVLVSSAITTAQAGVYTVVLKDANNCTTTKSITVTVIPKSYSTTTCNANGEQLIFKGAIDYIAIGNTMSQSEDRSNCVQNASSSKVLTLPAGAVVKAAYLYWSGSGALDNAVSLNGTNVTAQGTKTFYEPTWAMSFFAARADVTNLVQNSGTFTVNNLTWNNTGNYCYANSAYGAWSLAVVYEQVTLPYATIHINTDKFQYTYPAANYNSNINCVKVPTGVASNAKLTIISFEGDNYKGENLFIGGVNRGNNNFRGQSGPNLDILTFDVANVVTPSTTTLNYYIQSYLTNTIWGNAIEGLFDYVKILKYNTGGSITQNLAANTNDLLQIEANAESHKARIEWTNNTGDKNDYFTVEKVNPITGDFEKLERINNKVPTATMEHYAVYDNDPTEGDNTYRVTATYLDGAVKVSETKTLNFKGIESISLFPNPANDYVDIDLKKYNGLQVTVSVYNQFGKAIQTTQIDKASSAVFRLELGDVATGAYVVRVQPQGKRMVVRKLQIVR